jgi:iron uptake system component EfeO
MHSPRPFLALAAGIALVGALGACSKDDSTSTAASYKLMAGDDSCTVSETSIPAGNATFEVENTGSDVTEVYVYGKDGDDFTKIMGEVENIGPGTQRDLDVNLSAGDYQLACKPGMVGDGIRADLTVTGESDPSETAEAAYDRELEFEIESGGEVKAPSDLTAEVGEKIEFKLENGASEEYYLELLAPDGDSLGEAEAAASGDGEFVAALDEAGDYTVKTYADGAEDAAKTQVLTVAAP